MNRNQKIFRTIFIVFVLSTIGIAIHMGSKTTAPWNKKKQLIRAWRGDTVRSLNDTTKVH